MKKRFSSILLTALCVVFAAISLSACALLQLICNHEGYHTEPVIENEISSVGTQPGSYDEVVYCTKCEKEISRQTIPVYTNPLSSQTFIVKDGKISGTLPSANAVIDLDEYIVLLDGCTYVVTADEAGESVLNKNELTLESGDNAFYLSVTAPNEEVTTYTLELYLKKACTIYYYFDTSVANYSHTEVVEEGEFAVPYEFKKEGYVINYWLERVPNGWPKDFDFSQPITKDYHISAVWEVDTNIPYTIEYHFQNIENDEYTIDETRTFVGHGQAGQYVTPETPEVEGFTLKFYYGNAVYKILADGSLVIPVYYNRNSYTVTPTATSSGYTYSSAGYVTGKGTYRYGVEVTVKATTNKGYIFDGWFDGDVLVSSDEEYTFALSGDTALRAKWSARTDIPYKVVYRLQDAETDVYNVCEEETVEGVGTTGETVYAEIKTFTGFHHITSKGQKSDEISGDGSTEIHVFYDRDTFKIEATVNSITWGSVSGAGEHRYGAVKTLTANPYNGYSFVGWYVNDELVSEEMQLSFEVTESKSYVAKFAKRNDIKYTVEYYLQVISKKYPNYTVVYPAYESFTEEYTGTTGDYVDISDNTTATQAPKVIEGYRFDSYNSNNKVSGYIKGDGTLVLKLYYALRTYRTVVSNSNPSAGTVEELSKYFPSGLTFTLTATANNGYSFVGWYVNDEMISAEPEYEITVTEALEYVAKWEAHATTYRVTYYLQGLFTGSLLETKTFDSFVGETVTVPALESAIAQGLVLLTENRKTEGVVLPDGALILYAYYADLYCYYDSQTKYTYFGGYPQTVKQADVEITETIDSRGYYLGSDGYYYAKLVATPNNANFTGGGAINSGETYYFKVEPIRWREIKNYVGERTVICDSIIAMEMWNSSASNYPSSSIRTWLNGDFYNLAFSDSQKKLILTTSVLNSLPTMGPNADEYAPTVQDKVYLASYQDVTIKNYGFASATTEDSARLRSASDYVRAKGISVNEYGNSYWWLRSPYGSSIPNAVSAVNQYGKCASQYMHAKNVGVVPVITLDIY
ncbi:MAG: hypothetical protein IKA72_05315 [Clostridia bacterium]|nr:hypothetical protein [Clostridia bacterium]